MWRVIRFERAGASPRLYALSLRKLTLVYLSISCLLWCTLVRAEPTPAPRLDATSAPTTAPTPPLTSTPTHNAQVGPKYTRVPNPVPHTPLRSIVAHPPCDQGGHQHKISFVRDPRSRDRWRLNQESATWRDRLLNQIKLSCDQIQCNDEKYRANLLRSAQFPLYQNLDVERLEAAWGRLMQIGIFSPTSYLIIQPQDSPSLPPETAHSGVAITGTQKSAQGIPQKNTSSEISDETSGDPQEDAQRVRPDLVALQRGPVHLQVCLFNRDIVDSINVRYTSWSSFLYPKQFLSEIYKRLNLKRGAPYFDTPKERREQEAQIVSFYEGLGYRDVSATIVRKPVPDKPKHYTVDILISEGTQPLLSTPLIELKDDRMTASERVELKRRIYREVTPDLFFDLFTSFFKLFGVGTYDHKRIKNRAEVLENALRDEGWVTARIKVRVRIKERYSGSIKPLINVRRGPKLHVQFIGNQALKPQELMTELTFKKSGVLDELELETSRQNIIKRYKSASYYYVQVKARLKHLSKREVEAQFVIDEGPQVYVGDLVVIGMSAQHRKKILNAMVTKGVAPKGVLSTFGATAGILQEATLNQDLKRVLKTYDNLGYTRAQLRCAPLEELDFWTAESLKRRSDVWTTEVHKHRCFKVLADHPQRDQRRLLTILISLREGEKTSLNSVDYSPFDQTMDEDVLDQLEDLLSQLGFLDEIGQPTTQAGLNQSKLDVLQDFLISTLKRQGHLQAVVQPLCQLKATRLTLTDPEPCDLNALYGQTIERLSFKAKLGPRAEVSALITKGNLLTQENFIRQEMLLRAGDPLNADALLLSQNNLRSLGLFRSVRLTSIGLGTSPQGAAVEPVTLVMNLEEELPWLLDSYLGLRLSNQQQYAELQDINLLYTSALTLRHRNVGGRAWELGGGISHDNLITQPLDILGDWASWTAGPFFKNPRLLGTRIQLASELIFEQNMSSQRVAYVQRLRSSTTLSYDFYQLSFPRTWGRGLRFDLILEGRTERQRPISSSSERRAFGDLAPSFEIGPTLVYDRRDHPIHPTRGFYLTVGLDFLGSQDQTQGVEISYRETLSAQWVGGWFKRRLLLVPSLKLGAVQSSLSNNELTASRSDFLFIAGGDRVSYPVRGYPIGVINTCQVRDLRRGQCGDDYADTPPTSSDLLNFSGRALINMSIESRVSSLVIPNLWLAAFSDVGAVSEGIDAFDRHSFYPSVGVGVRYLFYGQVPLRLDIAYPLRSTILSAQEPNYSFDFFYTF